RLDTLLPEGALLFIHHTVKEHTGDRPAGILVTNDPLDWLGRCRGVLESPGVVDRPGLFVGNAGWRPRLGVNRGDRRAVAVQNVELGRGDRRAGDEQLGDPVAANAGDAEAAVGASRHGDVRRHSVEVPPGPIDTAVLGLSQPDRQVTVTGEPNALDLDPS